MNLGPGPNPPLSPRPSAPPTLPPQSTSRERSFARGGAAGRALVRGRGGDTTVFPQSGHPLGAAILGPAYLSGGEPRPLSRLLSSKVFVYPPAMC